MVRNTQPHFLVRLVPIVVVRFNFLSTVTIEYHVLIIRLHSYGNRIKSPRKKTPEKISLNAVEREPVETRVLNPNASEASYKPKQRSYRKTKSIFFRGDFLPRTLRSYREKK